MYCYAAPVPRVCMLSSCLQRLVLAVAPTYYFCHALPSYLAFTPLPFVMDNMGACDGQLLAYALLYNRTYVRS